MGIRGWLKSQAEEYSELSYFMKLGTEILGPPSGVRGMGTPLERAERIAAGRKEAARRMELAKKDSARLEREQEFGNGEVFGDSRNWTPPLHATTRKGLPVTVSFGLGKRDGETLICDDHVDSDTFYQRQNDGLKGHDHYLIDGRPAGGVIRGRYNG